jgi:cytochrome c
MYEQPKYTPFKESDFFEDKRAVRPLIPGTVARGHENADDLLNKGTVDGKLSTVFPFPITREVLERGAGRFEIYCTPCHDRLGTGNGIVVQRGMYPPPSFHIDRLRAAPPGHFFNVMTNGIGNMNPYANQLNVQDRWAVVAYIRALQLSQNARLSDVPDEDRKKLEAQR